MRTFALAILLCSSLHAAFSQILENEEIALLKENQGWSEGSIMLADGSELKGLVRYNDREGFVSFNDGENTRVFTSRKVQGFEFFDESKQRQRIYYTFPFEDDQKTKHPLLFEVIKEFKDFAILARAEPIQIYKKLRLTGLMLYGVGVVNPNSQYRAVASQVETIFIMDSDGSIKPYIEVTTKEDGLKSLVTEKDSKTKSKIIDEDLLAEYVTEPVYKKLKVYARENDLKFKQKGDFVKIMEYYEQMTK